MSRRAQPNPIVGKVDGKPIPVTVADCQQDMAQAAGPAAAREQLGHARSNGNAQTGPARHTGRRS